MDGLMLHRGAVEVDDELLREVPPPEPTPTYMPIAHHALLNAVRRELGASGLVISRQSLALSGARTGIFGDRFFGLLEIRGENDLYALTVGVRNSHDRMFPAGLCVGSKVFVCDNLSFSGEVTLARRHTRWIGRDLPGLINRAVGRLGDLGQSQHQRIEAYRNTRLDDLHFHDLAVRAVDAGVVCASKLPSVIGEWREPRHADFRERSAWSGFNAFTEIMKDCDLHDLARRTQALHGLFDLHCGLGARSEINN